jgi:hypothetical protein
MQTSLQIGTRGWIYPTWNEAFYDPDLPVEWQLSWYANHLRAVLVPADTMHEVNVARAQDWVEDTDPEFRFIVEIGPSSPDEGGDQARASFARSLAQSFVGQLDALLFTFQPASAPDWAALDTLRQDFPEVAICVDGVTADAMPAGFGNCWHVGEGASLVPSPYTVAFCAHGALSILREVIQTVRDTLPDRGALILTDPELAYHHAKEARMIADLLDA